MSGSLVPLQNEIYPNAATGGSSGECCDDESILSSCDRPNETSMVGLEDPLWFRGRDRNLSNLTVGGPLAVDRAVWVLRERAGPEDCAV